MSKKNILNEKMEAVKTWWDSDTTKAISTIIAVLLIPGAVLAWNYASGRNVKVEDSILEGDSTIEEPSMMTEDDSVTTTDETATNVEEESVMEEENTPVIAEETTMEEEKTDLQIGGISEVTKLPNTASSFE